MDRAREAECPHRWTHGAMPCEHCGNQKSTESDDAVRAELDDWRNFGFAHCGPPITCDQDMRDGIESMLRALSAKLADMRTLDDAATTETYWKTVPAKGGRWRCTRMVWRGDEYGEDWLPAEELDGPTPDAARHAAAEWVRSQR